MPNQTKLSKANKQAKVQDRGQRRKEGMRGGGSSASRKRAELHIFKLPIQLPCWPHAKLKSIYLRHL